MITSIKTFILTAVLFLTACATDHKEIETIDLMPFEPHFFDDAWQFVDLRSDDERALNGYINGFENIAFYEDLEDQHILMSSANWRFHPENIRDQTALEALFDRDKKIVLICRRGIRAHYVQAALTYLGYDEVYNAGAVEDYKGSHFVAPNHP